MFANRLPLERYRPLPVSSRRPCIINDLPRGVLSEILLLASQGSRDGPAYPSIWTTTEPWSFLSVCRQWRQLAESMPWLWGTFRVDLVYSQYSRDRKLWNDTNERLRVWLRMSMGAALTISYATNDYEFPESLLRNIGRWKSIEMNLHFMPLAHVNTLMETLIKAPELQSVSLSAPDYLLNLNSLSVRFGSLPYLRYLELESGLLETAYPTNLHHLAIQQHISILQFLEILDGSPYLAELFVNVKLNADDMDDLPPPGYQATYPSMQILSLSITSTIVDSTHRLPLFHLPALRDFRFSFEWRPLFCEDYLPDLCAPDFHSSILDILFQSQFMLQKLTFRVPNLCDADPLIRFLSLFPYLEEVEIFTKDMPDEAMRMLTRFPIGDPMIPSIYDNLCPYLKSLQWTSHNAFATEANIGHMIGSRWYYDSSVVFRFFNKNTLGIASTLLRFPDLVMLVDHGNCFSWNNKSLYFDDQKGFHVDDSILANLRKTDSGPFWTSRTLQSVVSPGWS